MKRIGKLAVLLLVFILSYVSCNANRDVSNNFLSIQKICKMDIKYAKMFSVDHYENDFSLITVGDVEQYLLVPENKEVPNNLPDNIKLIRQPVKNIYIVASSAMDMFSCINELDKIRFTSTMKINWTLPKIKEAIEDNKILYAGEYSKPDYELILNENCDLVIESTMISHNPEVVEQLKHMDIPVMTEYSSYESHPLGRMEWIKLYGLLTGKTKYAERYFNEKLKSIDSFIENKSTGKSVIFFSITSNGSVNIHKPGDYISEIIKLAGGINAITLDDIKVNGNLSIMRIQFEKFYSLAKDVDFLIYNSSIEGGVYSIDELLGKNSLFSDFKAVKNGNVWCTKRNMFQKSTAVADIIYDMHLIFTGNIRKKEMDYIFNLE